MTGSLVVAYMQRKFPDWQPPDADQARQGRVWLPCLCPWHGDEHMSAGISYELDSFKCLACSVGGNAVTLIAQQEGVSNQEAYRIAQEVAESSGITVSAIAARQPSRGISEDTGLGDRVSRSPSRDRQVPSRLRGRSAPRR